MAEPTAQPPEQRIPTEAEQLTVVRARLRRLDRAVDWYEHILERTGKEREAAYKALVDARVMSFREAIICDVEISEANREHWLSAPLAGGEQP